MENKQKKLKKKKSYFPKSGGTRALGILRRFQELKCKVRGSEFLRGEIPDSVHGWKNGINKGVKDVSGGKKKEQKKRKIKGEEKKKGKIPSHREREPAPAFPMEAPEKAPANPQNPGAGLPFSRRQLNLLQDIGI